MDPFQWLIGAIIYRARYRGYSLGGFEYGVYSEGHYDIGRGKYDIDREL